MIRSNHVRNLTLSSLLFFSSTTLLFGGTANWISGTGNWTDPTRWTSNPVDNYPLNGVAGENWSATLSSGTISLTSSIVVDNFTMTNGQLQGAFNFTIEDSFNWSRGTVGSGTIVNIPIGSTLNATGSSKKTLSSSTLNNNGLIEFSGSNVELIGDVVVNNQGTISFPGDVGISALTGSERVVNHGSMIKTGAGTGSGIGGGIFDHFGSITVNSGSLSISPAQGTIHTGSTINVAAGATFGITNSFGSVSFEDGTAISGDGVFQAVRISVAGTTHVNQIDLIDAGNVRIDGPGILIVNDRCNWLSGEMAGTGTTRIEANAVIALQAQQLTLATRTLENRGTFNQSDGCDLLGGGTILNSGTINLGIDTSIAPKLTNSGTIISNNSSDTFANTIHGTLQTTGLVEVESGFLLIAGTNSTASGATFAVQPGASLLLGTFGSTKNITLSAGTTFTGGGTIHFQNVIVDGNISTPSMRMSPADVLKGSGILTATGSGLWHGGNQSGTGITRIANGAIVDLSNDSLNLDRVLENYGTLNLLPQASITGSGGSVIGRLDNFGLLTSTSGFSTSIGQPFRNAGSVQVLEGDLFFTQGFKQTAGLFSLLGGDSGGTMEFAGGRLEGTGELSGTTLFSGPVVVGPGILTLSSTVTFSAAQALSFSIDGTDVGTGFGKFVLSGGLSLAGQLKIATSDAFIPGAGDVFELLTAGELMGAFSNVSSGSTLLSENGQDSFNVFYGVGSPYGATRIVLTSTVPEPSSSLLLLGSALGLLMKRRRGTQPK